MFDIGFFELIIIGVVALLVVGPERLPKLAVTVGQYVGRIQRMWQNTKYEIEREVHNAEIKQVTDHIGDDLHNIVDDLDDEMHALNHDLADDSQAPLKSEPSTIKASPKQGKES